MCECGLQVTDNVATSVRFWTRPDQACALADVLAAGGARERSFLKSPASTEAARDTPALCRGGSGSPLITETAAAAKTRDKSTPLFFTGRQVARVTSAYSEARAR